MTRKRILIAITLFSATAATVIVAGGGRSYSSAPTAARTVTVTSYDRRGPGAQCDSDSCGIGFADGPTVRIPAGGSSYTAIVTISMQYDTSGKGKPTFEASMWTPDNRPHHFVQPRVRGLERATSPQSTTLVYRVTHLVPGHSYTVRYAPGIRPPGGHAHVTTNRVLVVVTARPTVHS